MSDRDIRAISNRIYFRSIQRRPIAKNNRSVKYVIGASRVLEC